jgi:hypothetical protein
MISNWSTTYTQTDTSAKTNDTTYYYRIKFRNGDGIETGTYYESVTVVSVPPATPSMLQLTGKTTTSVTLQWQDNSTDEHGFEYQDFSSNMIAQLGANVTTYTETGLHENQYIIRQIRAFRDIPGRIYSGPTAGAGIYTYVEDPVDSDWTITTTLTTVDIVITSPPMNSTEGETGVLIERDTDPGFSAPVTVYGWSNVYSFSDTPPAGTYYYRIKFRNGHAAVQATAPSPGKQAIIPP